MWETVWIAIMSAWLTIVFVVLLYRLNGRQSVTPFVLVGTNIIVTASICIFGRFFDTHGVSPPKSYAIAAGEPILLALILIAARAFRAQSGNRK